MPEQYQLLGPTIVLLDGDEWRIPEALGKKDKDWSPIPTSWIGGRVSAIGLGVEIRRAVVMPTKEERGIPEGHFHKTSNGAMLLSPGAWRMLSGALRDAHRRVYGPIKTKAEDDEDVKPLLWLFDACEASGYEFERLT